MNELIIQHFLERCALPFILMISSKLYLNVLLRIFNEELLCN